MFSHREGYFRSMSWENLPVGRYQVPLQSFNKYNKVWERSQRRGTTQGKDKSGSDEVVGKTVNILFWLVVVYFPYLRRSSILTLCVLLLQHPQVPPQSVTLSNHGEVVLTRSSPVSRESTVKCYTNVSNRLVRHGIGEVRNIKRLILQITNKIS